MLAENFRYKYNYADDVNKHVQTTSLSRLNNNASSLQLDDFQIVGSSNFSEKAGNESKYEPNGKLKEDVKKEAKDKHLEELFGIEKDDKKPENLKSENEKIHAHGNGKHDGFDKDCPLCECETCKNRRYQDGSDDSAVSFQQPTKMNPTQASYKVRAHEMEHVRREQHKAKENDERVVAQSVQIHTSICPECGTTYVSGGKTRTSKKYCNPDYIDLFKVGADDMFKKGNVMDASA